MNFKRLCIFAGAALFCFCVFFHQLILSFASEKILRACSVYYLGEPLCYHSVYFTGHQLIIKDPHLLQKERFSAKQLILQWDFDFNLRQFNLTLSLDQPSWQIGEGQADWTIFKARLDRMGILRGINPRIKIQNGFLSWRLANQPDQHLRFSIEVDGRSGGFLEARLDDSIALSRPFTLRATSQPEGMHVDWDCQGLKCASLLKLATLLFPQLEVLKVSSGYLHGHLKAIFPMNKRKPYIEGNMTLEDLAFMQASSIQAEVKEAKLLLQKELTHFLNPEEFFITTGRLEITQPATFSYLEDGNVAWQLDNITGTIELGKARELLLALNADGCYQQYSIPFGLEGKMQLDKRQLLNFNFNCHAQKLSDPNMQLHFYQQEGSSSVLELACDHLTAIELGFLKTLLSSSWPALKQLEFREGLCHILCQMHLTKTGLETIRFQQLDIHNLAFKILSWDTLFYFKKGTGQALVDFSSADIWHSLNADLHIEEGQINFEGINGYLSSLTHIYTSLIIQNGIIDHSLVKLNLAGLKGILDIQWGGQQELLALDVEGQVKDLAELLPTVLQKGIHEHLQQDRARLCANIKHKGNQFETEGTIHLTDAKQSKQFHLIHFGCEWNKDPKGSKMVPSGWFYAKQIPLEKFLSPFIFRNNSLLLSGIGEFRGSFDTTQVTVSYQPKDLKIENEDLLIEVKDAEASSKMPFIGTHHFDLKTHSHEGTLPISHASYLEKHTGLIFTDIQTDVLFKDQAIHMKSLETFCQGVHLAGSLTLDYSDPAPGVFSIQAKAPDFDGKVSHVQHLLSRLGESPQILRTIPLEGDIEGRNDGIILTFDFVPHDYHLQAFIQGSITNGAIAFQNVDVALQGLYMDVDYHHDRKKLEFTDIQGTLLVGKPKCTEEYSLAGHHLSFCYLNEPECVDIDMWVSDHSHQLMRLVAHTQCLHPSYINVVFNQALSHFGHIHPSAIQLVLKDWSEIDFFELKAQIDLELFWRDFQFLGRAGLVHLLSYFQQELKAIKEARGLFDLSLGYNHLQNLLSYQMRGNNIQIGPFAYQEFLFEGQKRDKKWIIDHLQLDEFSLYAEMEHRQDKWRINFLGLTDSSSLLLGLEGEIIPEEKCIKTKINLLESDLAYLNKWECLKPFMAAYDLSGPFKGSGTMKFQFLSEYPWYQIDSTINCLIPYLRVKESLLVSKQPIQLHIQTDQGIWVDQVEMSLKEGPQEQSYLAIKQWHYSWAEDHIKCPQMTLKIPSLYLKEVANKLHNHFPHLVDERLKDVLATFKAEGDLQAHLAFDKDPQKYSGHLTFDDGIYTFKKRNYELQKFYVRLDSNELQFSALSQEERCPYLIQGKAFSPNLDHGELIVADSFSKQPLIIKWSDHPLEGFVIQSIKGHFCGLNVDLNSVSIPSRMPPWSVLSGIVDINFNQLCPLLTEATAAVVKDLNLGPNYTLEGIWQLNPDMGTSLCETLLFQGLLCSQNTILKGYRLEQMKADLCYTPMHLKAHNLTIEDEAGRMSCPEFTVIKDEFNESWLLFIPSLTVKNLKPALLREEGQATTSTFKNLLIRRLYLQDFFGKLSDIASWQATGNLYFLNPSRKNFYHPLLAIPAELILRLGLNPEVLNPVTGTVYFNLQGNRFYLTKFKDVYSEGRGSKFYLAQHTSPSWMDMKGNLFVNIRMKQYNLLFKLAELFTVSIQGNLKKPIYTFQKHAKLPRKEAKSVNEKTQSNLFLVN